MRNKAIHPYVFLCPAIRKNRAVKPKMALHTAFQLLALGKSHTKYHTGKAARTAGCCGVSHTFVWLALSCMNSNVMEAFGNLLKTFVSMLSYRHISGEIWIFLLHPKQCKKRGTTLCRTPEKVVTERASNLTKENN